MKPAVMAGGMRPAPPTYRFEFQTARPNRIAVFASEAKQSMARHRKIEDGLLRRFAQP
jgi:hypothetical protein